MNQNDLFKVEIHYKNGEYYKGVLSLHEFENFYGNELREIYFVCLELVKECNN